MDAKVERPNPKFYNLESSPTMGTICFSMCVYHIQRLALSTFPSPTHNLEKEDAKM
jgi:hypothetical protein